MGVSQDVKEFLTLSKGVISEAPPTAFPEDGAVECNNFVLGRDGSIKRRLGIDYESGYALTDTTFTGTTFASKAISTYRWDNVGGDSTKSLSVVQVGTTLYFFDLYTQSPSANVISFSLTSASVVDTIVTKSSTVIPPVLTQNVECQYASVQGDLIVTIGSHAVYRIAFDASTLSITGESFNLRVRDIWGVESTESGTAIATDHRPTVLDNTHRYNLYNQGYPKDDFYAYVEGSAGSKRKCDVLDYTFGGHTNVSVFGISEFDGLGFYPSNTDDFATAVTTSADEPPTDIDGFNPNKLESQALGNTPVIRGHYIIDPFIRSTLRAAESGLTLDTDADNGGASSVVASGGRLFYSSIVQYAKSTQISTAPKMGSTVMFSRVIRSKSDYGKCYQEADPTSIEDSQLLPDDGGTITIAEAGKILRLEAIGSSIAVVAENGVWEIRGGESGFEATDFYVRKVTNVGAVSASSIVNVEGSVLYWSNAGIYALSTEQVSRTLVAQNVTQATIQTKYLSIPGTARGRCIGFFDSAARLVRWAYNDTSDYDTDPNQYNFNRELVYDLSLGAFTFTTIEQVSSGPQLAGYVATPEYSTDTRTLNVLSGVDQVVNGVGDDVVISQTVRTSGASALKMLTVVPGTTYSITLSEFNNTSYLDWETFDSVGVDSPAFAEFGYLTFGDSSRRKQTKYLTMHFKRTETGFEFSGDDLVASNESSCKTRVVWGYADTSTYAKYGTQFEAYRLRRLYMPSGVNDDFEYGESIITTKSVLRGSGIAMRLRIDSSPRKALHLYGWSLNIIGMSGV